MYKVYYMIPKQHPVLVAEYEDEQYAQILVDAGNKLYDDGREFWLEQDEPPATDEAEAENYKAEIVRDFDRGEAKAINRSR